MILEDKKNITSKISKKSWTQFFSFKILVGIFGFFFNKGIIN